MAAALSVLRSIAAKPLVPPTWSITVLVVVESLVNVSGFVGTVTLTTAWSAAALGFFLGIQRVRAEFWQREKKIEENKRRILALKHQEKTE